MPRKNEILTLAVRDLNNLGYGVAAAEDGKVVFIAGAADGDLCEVKIIKEARDYAVGRLLRVLSPSPHRTAAPHCPHKGCGGCAYTAVTYEHERALKRRTVEAAFRKAGLSATVAEVESPSATLGYRNKAQYPVAKGADGGIVIGFYAPKSHRVVEAADCPLMPPVFTEIVHTVRAHAEAAGIPPYDEESKSGLLRHLYLRAAEDCREILLTLVVTEESYPQKDALLALLTKKFPMLVGVLLNIQKESTNVILGKEYRTLYGRDYLTDTLADVRLTISPAAFYQVNRVTAEALYRKAAELAALTGDELVLDLYCGTGSIGLSMAGKCRRLLGIEIVPEAVENAKRNAAAAGITNATFVAGDAASTAEILRAVGEDSPDVILLDPPRAGLDEALIRTVSALSPRRVVYISCNPTTLARDILLFKEQGFSAGEVFLFDMFPRTGHVESLVCLTRQTN